MRPREKFRPPCAAEKRAGEAHTALAERFDAGERVHLADLFHDLFGESDDDFIGMSSDEE